MKDYRYNAFDDVLEPIAITGETHIIPSNSPYTIRLAEVPQKTDPSSISLTIAGVAASEVAAQPAAGEFWPDYSTSADGDTNWNTGLIKFNAADAGKTVVVSYNGMGSLASADYRGHQLFTTSGTFTVPKGVKTVYVSGCGGGGGGGNSDADNCGGGGGGGQACIKTSVNVVPGQSYVITIGSGGSAQSAGGSSSFGVLLTLSGGGGGSGVSGGSAGGTGGSNGQSSGMGYPDANYQYLTYIAGGMGGGTIFGSGGGGGRGYYGSSAGNGYSGGLYGGGGGGAGMGATRTGGAGAQGFILVEW